MQKKKDKNSIFFNKILNELLLLSQLDWNGELGYTLEVLTSG
jgi:hypothetical protein